MVKHLIFICSKYLSVNYSPHEDEVVNLSDKYAMTRKGAIFCEKNGYI